MPAVPVRLAPTVDLGAAFDAIRAELGIVDGFAPAVQAEAQQVADRGPVVPDGAGRVGLADRRDIPFVTIDPTGSRDLDQAVSIARATGGPGYVVRYAIADVAGFVAPGGAVDDEARRRAVTVYLPDHKAPLHPPVLSEGAASLLPGVDRQAVVWDITLDTDGETRSMHLGRAVVRSRAQLSYDGVQAALDTGSADDQMQLLREVGRLREQREIDRGGVSLPIPEQEVVEVAGQYRLAYRAPRPVEGWNAQISLLAGMCAARLMIDGGTGVLRTLPPPTPEVIETLRRRAEALDVPWPAGARYADVIRSLDPSRPAHAALIIQSARLFRGAGYLAFVDGAPPTAEAVHAAVASSYAHVTAPLRRLVDRFANEVVLAQCAERPVPGWVRDALDELPELMADGRHREGAANGAALDLVEASVLAGCIGSELDGVVTNVRDDDAQVQIRDPAVVATVHSRSLELGEQVRLRVTGADLLARRVDLEVVTPDR